MLDDLVEPFLVRLMACNADDGSACGMVGTTEMRAAFHEAVSVYRSVFPMGPEREFRRLFREACLGAADLPPPPERPPPPPFAQLTHEPLDVADVSTVVPIATLLRLMSSDDKRRFERRYGVRFTATGASEGADFLEKAEEMLVRRLGRIPIDSRYFRIAPEEAHGRPYVWVTPKQDLNQALAARNGPNLTLADIARDFLGLVHHGPYARGSAGLNHLVALHIPAAVVATAGYMRPSAVQAFDNRRFIQRFGAGDRGSDADWGRALDLYLFASNAREPIGGRERVLLRLQDSLLQGGNVIRFDHLEAVLSLRGNTPKLDDDETFLDLVRGDRDAERLALEMCQ